MYKTNIIQLLLSGGRIQVVVMVVTSIIMAMSP